MENYFTNQGPVVTATGAIHVVTNINYAHLDQKQESIYFHYHRPVKDFVGRSNELVRLKEATIDREENKGPIVVVSGLGGIGKSQLVQKFVEQNRWYYRNVVWINSRKYGSLEENIKSLASHCLQISTYVNGKEKDFQTLTQEVFSKLSESRTLMVFDNVDEIESARVILRMAIDAVRIHTVITSRIQEWSDSIEIIKLDVLTPDDALEFVSRQLAGHDSMEEKKELVEILHNFPVALRQATAHIKYHRKIGNYKISNYIDEYNNGRENILKSHYFKADIMNRYGETTLTVWGTTMNAIEKCGEEGELALRILRIIAYFDPDHIRRDIFFYLKHPSSRRTLDHTAVRSAVRLLIQYSMVDGFELQSVLRIHRLVQQVIRIQLEKAKGEERTLREAFQLITAMEKHENFNECHEHGISVFRSAMKFDGLVREFKGYGVMILESLNAFGKYLRAETFGTEISYLYRPEDWPSQSW